LRLFKNQNLLDLVVRRNKEKLEKMDMEIDMEIEGVDEREQDGELSHSSGIMGITRCN
jgi:hypothetical protein